jgi:branched-chain amino acid transport system substrate-binding protein
MNIPGTLLRRKYARLALVASIAALALTACSNNSGGNTASTDPTASSSSTAGGGAIKIGILSICGGPFATFEAESFSGAKYALIKDANGQAQGQQPQDQISGATVAGKPITITFGCSDASPDKAVAEARRLVENVGVKILLGPLSGDEGIAVANYAKSVPDVTFVNGTSGAQSTTLPPIAPNFFRFGGDGAQWMAGLGTYAYKTLGWRKVAILAEDYSYPYTQAAGFIAEFGSLGGKISSRTYVPLTQTDWSSPVAKLPRDVDGVLLLTGGSNTVAAEKAFIQIGKVPGKFLLGGSSVMDPTSFTVGAPLVGLTGGSPVPLGGTDSAWATYASGFSSAFPAAPGDSLFTVLYYDGMEAIIKGLTNSKGATGTSLQSALGTLQMDFPNGQVKLDSNRNAIQPNYVVQITNDGGKLGFKVVNTIVNVDQTFGGLFGPTSKAPSRTEPQATAGNLPPWAK